MSSASQEKATATETTTQEGDALDQMLSVVDALKPKSDSARKEIESSVSTLLEHILPDFDSISKDSPEVLDKIEKLISEIDLRLTNQMNKILHHKDFQTLEGSWRGLHHMVNSTESSDQLKVKVINVTKKELYKQLKNKDRAGWDQTELFKKIYEEEYGTPGGSPFGCIIGSRMGSHQEYRILLRRFS